MEIAKIIRSSTPTHFFSTIYTDIDLTIVDSIEVRYMQDKELVFTKSGDDISLQTKTQFLVELSEEDTNKLNPDLKVYIRVVLHAGDKRIPSTNVICAEVEDL